VAEGLTPLARTAGHTLVGLGIDHVDIARLAAMLERRPAMAERLFTAGEQAYASGMRDPAPSLAARFAAKEATMKALGVGLGAFDFADVDVRRVGLGPPILGVTGRAATLAASLGVSGWMVSLTHTHSLASAVVAALA
jgi:holo-[acyl-carrier protein] synthase